MGPASTSGTVRPPITRERIIEAALELIDRDGLDRLSMRRLATELGIEAMSLYHHVQDKSDVLDGVVALVLSEMEPVQQSAWDERVRHVARELRRVVLAHPQVHLLVLERALGSAAVVEPARQLFDALVEAPMGHDVAVRSFWITMSFVSGSLSCELTEVPDVDAAAVFPDGLFSVDLDEQFEAGLRTLTAAFARQ
ncbi:MAG: TetR/AcrR family transcriptional regulator [Microthrixaceae bacterium]